MVGWRTVPPAAWLRVAPSAEVGEQEWMVKVGPAGGTERCRLPCERQITNGCAIGLHDSESSAAGLARSPPCGVVDAIRLVVRSSCRPPQVSEQYVPNLVAGKLHQPSAVVDDESANLNCATHNGRLQ